MREEVHALLREQGVTTVLVTHDQEEALSLADDVAVLRDGKIVQQGTPADLYERPADELLARFLGAVNVVEAEFRDGAAQHAARARSRCAASIPTAPATGYVMVRPEQLEVSPRDTQATPPSAGTTLLGHVEQCRYYGHDAVLHIRPQTRGAGEVLLARVHGERALPVGHSGDRRRTRAGHRAAVSGGGCRRGASRHAAV